MKVCLCVASVSMNILQPPKSPMSFSAGSPMNVLMRGVKNEIKSDIVINIPHVLNILSLSYRDMI